MSRKNSTRKALETAPKPIDERWAEYRLLGLGPIVPICFAKAEPGKKPRPFVSRKVKILVDDYADDEDDSLASTDFHAPSYTREYTETFCMDRDVSTYTGLALVTGRKSGVIELDLDQLNLGEKDITAGIELYDRLHDEGILNKAPVIVSPSGGAKIWFRYPKDGRITYQGKTFMLVHATKCLYLGGKRYAADILTANHLTTLPGSVRGGKLYEWLDPGRRFTGVANLPELPQSLIPYFFPPEGHGWPSCLRELDIEPCSEKLKKDLLHQEICAKEEREWDPPERWEVERLVQMLNDRRARDRDPWMRVGMAIASWHWQLGKEIFDTFSARAENYDEAGVDEFWRSLKNSSGSGSKITLGSLHHWAKEDDPKAYALLRASKRKRYIGDLYQEDGGMARFVAKEVDGDLICLTTKGDDVWLFYDDAKALWVTRTHANLVVYVMDILREAVEAEIKSMPSLETIGTDRSELKAYNDKKKGLVALLKRVQKESVARSVLRTLMPMLEDTKEIFSRLNTIPYLLPLRNRQTLDLRTGEVRDRVREDYFSVECPVLGVGNRYAEDVQNFVSYLWPSQEIRDYMQILLGFMLTGEACDRLFWIFYGPVANGKTAVTSIMERLMGPLAGSVDPNVLCKNRGDLDVKPEPEMEKFMKCRFVSVSETAKKASLNEAKIKKLTGNDSIGFRLLFSNEYKTFRSKAKIVMSTNYCPTFSSDDEGMQDRVRYCKFSTRFTATGPSSPEKSGDGYVCRRDTAMIDRLTRQESYERREEEGIRDFLDWLLEGVMKYYADPTLVRKQPKAFENFKAAEWKKLSSVSMFLDARTSLISSGEEGAKGRKGEEYKALTRLSPLYALYRSWVQDTDEQPVSATKFAIDLKAHYPACTFGKVGGCVAVSGLVVYSEDPFDEVAPEEESSTAESSSEVTPPQKCLKVTPVRKKSADMEHQRNLRKKYGTVTNVPV